MKWLCWLVVLVIQVHGNSCTEAFFQQAVSDALKASEPKEPEKRSFEKLLARLQSDWNKHEDGGDEEHPSHEDVNEEDINEESKDTKRTT